MMSNSKKKYKNFGEYQYWIYANLNMYMMAQSTGRSSYDRACFMARAKAFKAYKEGRWKIHSLFENNNWKMDWGKGTCWYCGDTEDSCGKLTADHIFPRSKRGDDSFDNIAYACKECNSSKGNSDFIEWFYTKWGQIPPMYMVCIYLKLMYKYSIEHNLMELHSEELDKMTLPFNYRSLMIIEAYLRDRHLESESDLNDT